METGFVLIIIVSSYGTLLTNNMVSLWNETDQLSNCKLSSIHSAQWSYLSIP